MNAQATLGVFVCPSAALTGWRFFVDRNQLAPLRKDHALTQSIAAAPLTQAGAPPSILVSTGWLATRLQATDLRILDARSTEEYAEAHIPGALHLELPAITTTVDGVPGMLVGAETFATVMGSLGIGATTTVVVYDGNWGLPASRIVWALTYFGHANAAVLDGGWDQWQEEERPSDIRSESPRPTQFTAQPTPDHLAELAWLQAHLDDPNIVILDTRADGEVAQGTVPNAVHWDWMSSVPVGSWGARRPAEELRDELAARGVTPDKEIVTYCRSGVRAAHTYVVLRSLGYDRVRNYDGSWLEWSHRVLGLDHA